MKNNKTIRVILCFFICCTARFFVQPANALYAAEQAHTITSPNGKIKVEVLPGNQLSYAVFHNNQTILSHSNIGLVLDNGTILGQNAQVLSKKVKKEKKDNIESPFYRFSRFVVTYNELDLKLNGNMGLTFRVYDDGVAYRFYTTGKQELTIKDEIASFNFDKDHTVYLSHSTNEKNPLAMAFQNIYQVRPLSEASSQLAFLPATVDYGNGVKMTLLESDLEAYPGMFLQAQQGNQSLKGVFSPLPAKTDFYPWRKQEYIKEYQTHIAHVKGTRTYPWRILAITEKDTDMPVNNLVYALASPNRIGDYSWIKTGKVAWDWWNDWGLKGVGFKAGINMDTYKYYIDFASRNGIEFVILDEGWYDPKSGDMLTVIPELNLPELVAYGKSKGVDLILWTVFNVLDSQLEAACRQYAEMGIKGFKVDFLDRDDQTGVEMVYRIAEATAKHKLTLDLHGIYKPTGLNRTYPNILNFEGLFGMEEVKWSKVEKDMPLYDVTFPYIRMMAGPVDYTPGAMRNATQKDFQPMYYNPMSMGTRCHQLAAYIVHDSPLTMLCDAPTNYLNEQECVDFIVSIPVEVDYTRILDGKMGEYIITARNKGNTWHVGGMTNWTARSVPVDFGFLPQGKQYKAIVFTDGINAEKQASDYTVNEIEVNSNTQIEVQMASGGGFAIRIQENCTHLQRSNVVPAKTTYFGIADVRLLDSPFKQAMMLNAQWMLELDIDKLLSNFRTNAGLTPKNTPYGSWESMGIAGHTLGHYLTAAAQHYAATGDEQFKEKVNYIVSELDSCQINFVNGFVGGMPGGDKVFKEVKKGIIRSKGFDLNGIWVPWYNEHKTMMGLSDAYLLVGNKKAKEVLINLSDYLADCVSTLNDAQIQAMLDCEYGGMNEAFAQVYALTGDKKYLDASYVFYHKKIQDKLADGIDALQGLHSNTQIPKLIGSARQYELTGNERDRKIAQFSWETLVHHHSYANGGNSMGEYLSVPDKLSDRLGSNTCETCNTYNMLKLTQHLYEWTNDPQYIDYYERALYNHILSSQHPVEGRVCYFLSLGMGSKKGFGSKHNNFSCCMGSGFENHSKYGGAIYSYGNEALYVNLYIPSVLTWEAKGVLLKMETAYPEKGKVSIRLEECPTQTFEINLRHPAWAGSGTTVRVNGNKQNIQPAAESNTGALPAFITLNRKWKKGDRIEIDFPMSIYTVAMPDNADRRAVFYGPSLLAGVFGSEERKMGDIPVFVNAEKSITNYIKRTGETPLRFATLPAGGIDHVTLMPFYQVYDQYQTVYWDVYSPAEWSEVEAKRKAELNRIAELDKRTLDYIVLGEMQPERDHNFDGENTRFGEGYLRKYRFAYENGWFAFEAKANGQAPTQLLLTYYGGDTRRPTFRIEIGDWSTPVTFTEHTEGFVEHIIDIPAEVTQGKGKIKIVFKADDKNRVSNIYNCRLMKAPGRDSQIPSVPLNK